MGERPMSSHRKIEHQGPPVSRRSLLQVGAGLAGTALLPIGLTGTAYAVGDHPASAPGRAAPQGSSVTIGAAVPRTGAYAAQGEDELKGWQLAVEHINTD